MSPGPELLAITARSARDGLIAAECAALTGGQPGADGIAHCRSVDLVERAAFVHVGLEVLARAGTFDELVDAVAERARAGFEADRFRVDVHDPDDRSALTSTQVATAIADVIPYGPDLKDPQHQFIVVFDADGCAFASVIAAADNAYRRHDDKPWTTSSSLDSRFARGLVNLVPDATSILDPCCGAGSIVLEAASLGIDAHGVDWKTALVGMTNENLAHFDYDATVTKADSRRHVQPVDAIVTDLPYGNAITSEEHVVRAILEQCAGQAPRGVFVAPADISNWLTAAGYVDVEIHTVNKRRGFTRWIHVVRR